MSPCTVSSAGAFFSERGADVQIKFEHLSANGQMRYDSHTTLLCAQCMEALNHGTNRKSPIMPSENEEHMAFEEAGNHGSV